MIALPFLGRAHSIDDPLYLESARHVLAHPLDPLAGASFWHDRPATLFDDLFNPPLTAYLLAVPLALGGGSEAAVHLLMVLLALLALGATVAAGRQLDVPPRVALLLATSPALALASVSAMTDVPFLLITVLAYGAALRGRATSAGSLAGLGALTKYSGLLGLVPVTLRLRGRDRWRAVTATAVVFGAWCLASFALYGRLHPRTASRFQTLDGRLQVELLVSFVASLGLVGLPSALGLLRWNRPSIAVSLLAGAAGAWGLGGHAGSASVAAVSFGCLASGVAVLLAAARASLRTRDPFLIAAFWLPAAYAVTFVYFGASRYVLPLLPPLLWLLHRGDAFVADASPRRWALSAVAGAGVCWVLLWGDAGYANAWRTAARRLPSAPRGFESGHWGFQWYAVRYGYAPLLPRQDLEPGDVVAAAVGIHAAQLVPAQEAVLSDRGRIAVASPVVRVMDSGVGAGLYSSAWGLLPFGFRPDAEEVVRLGTPTPWLASVAGRPPGGPVVLDMGSPGARWAELDGWSGEETFDDGGIRRSFVWTVGPEAALRVSLPAGLRRFALHAFPMPQAVGPLDVAIGTSARATVTLAEGWHIYEGAVDGTVAGGLTTVVLRPAGYRRPGPFARERRELALAIDGIAFGDGDPTAVNRGVWPVAVAEGRGGLLVAGEPARLTDAAARRVRLRVVASEAQVLWLSDAAPQVLWSAAASCGAPEGCAVDVVTPPRPGRCVLDAARALVSDLVVEPPSP